MNGLEKYFICFVRLVFFQITAERERQEIAIELARQVEENKRLRRSLLAQSAKFVTLRQVTNTNDASLPTFDDHQNTPVRITLLIDVLILSSFF